MSAVSSCSVSCGPGGGGGAAAAGGAAAIAGFGLAAGFGAAAFGAAGAAALAGADGAGIAAGAVDAAGGGEAGAAAAAGGDAGLGGAAGAACAGAPIASTAARHPGDVAFFFRHCIASGPPGLTPEHLDMKSERQFCLTALICASVGCWARATPESHATPSATRAAERTGVRTFKSISFSFFGRPCAGSDGQGPSGTPFKIWQWEKITIFLCIALRLMTLHG